MAELNIVQIDTLEVEAVTPEVFADYLKKNRPLKIKQGACHWPAIGKWTPQWLASEHGDTVVPIAQGDRRAINWTSMAIEQFVGAMEPSEEQLYLRQFNLFDPLPELKMDFQNPKYCPTDRLILPHFWMGSNTLQPFHQDHHHVMDGISNLFTQVYGKKTVILADDQQTPFLYKRNESQKDAHLSNVELEKPDFERFPLLAQAKLLQTELEAGDMLLIPTRYWHFLQSHGASISVSFWWRPHKISDLSSQLQSLIADPQKLQLFVAKHNGAIKFADVKAFGIDNLKAALPLLGDSREIIMSLFDPSVRMVLNQVS